jgi:glycosyltransferase involved in cell wall biosynthesis
VVTINYNDACNLERTLKSIDLSLGENYVELIVIDGGSTDNSLNLLDNYSYMVKSVISEKDTGIYDAMNKGIKNSTGNAIIFINAGDEINSAFNFDKLYQWADAESINLSQICVVTDNYQCIDDYKVLREIDISSNNWHSKKLPSHQAVFIPREYFIKNLFDTTFNISSDTKYLRGLFNAQNTIKYQIPVSDFYLGGVSSNWKTFKEFFDHLNERDRVMKFSKLAKIKLYVKGIIKYTLIKLIGYKAYYKWSLGMKKNDQI